MGIRRQRATTRRELRFDQRRTLGPRRPAVGTGLPDDPDDDAGTAGVREPRRPLPNPLSAAGALPEPEPFTYMKLAEARH